MERIPQKAKVAIKGEGCHIGILGSIEFSYRAKPKGSATSAAEDLHTFHISWLTHKPERISRNNPSQRRAFEVSYASGKLSTDNELGITGEIDAHCQQAGRL